MRNCAHFSQFQEQSRRISLHFRLCGGEGDIRTLGTGLNRARAHTSLTYRESTTSEFSQTARLPRSRAKQCGSSTSQRRTAGDSVGESAHFGILFTLQRLQSVTARPSGLPAAGTLRSGIWPFRASLPPSNHYVSALELSPKGSVNVADVSKEILCPIRLSVSAWLLCPLWGRLPYANCGSSFSMSPQTRNYAEISWSRSLLIDFRSRRSDQSARVLVVGFVTSVKRLRETPTPQFPPPRISGPAPASSGSGAIKST